MIQRIQSLYLALSGVFCLLLFIIPFAASEATGELLKAQDYIGTTITVVLAALLSFINIFMYKNRMLQIRLGILNIAVDIAVLLMMHIAAYKEPLSFTFDSLYNNAHIGILLPFLSIMAIALANKNIRKDEELVRSADRFR